MREIKFRGKRVDNGEWVYGYLMGIDADNIAYIGYDERVSQVIAETVGQFTGLHDKNGKEIYEGDIASFYHHHKKYKGFIGVDTYNHFCIYNIKCSDRWSFHIESAMRGKIIGNIHDNPELLKGK